jgi:hypothetical protein
MDKNAATEIAKRLRKAAEELENEPVKQPTSSKTVKIAQILTAARAIGTLRTLLNGSR